MTSTTTNDDDLLEHSLIRTEEQKCVSKLTDLWTWGSSTISNDYDLPSQIINLSDQLAYHSTEALLRLLRLLRLY